MKKFVYLFFVFILFIASKGKAQTENSLLWEITGNGLTKPSYLFGTIHIIPKKDFFITEKMLDALNNSEIFVTEIDMNIPVKEQFNIAKQMYLPDKKTYKDYLSEEKYVKVSSYLIDSLDIRKRKLKSIFRIKPFFASGLILKEYYKRVKAYEVELKKLARRNNMEFGALETIEEQLALVNDMSLDEQFENLEVDIASLSTYDQMVNCYTSQDLECMQELLFADESGDVFMQMFLTDRNKKWIQKIEEYISHKSTFFAFGAGHLIGDEGVVNLLRQEGYTLKPLGN